MKEQDNSLNGRQLTKSSSLGSLSKGEIEQQRARMIEFEWRLQATVSYHIYCRHNYNNTRFLNPAEDSHAAPVWTARKLSELPKGRIYLQSRGWIVWLTKRARKVGENNETPLGLSPALYRYYCEPCWQSDCQTDHRAGCETVQYYRRYWGNFSNGNNGAPQDEPQLW